MKESKQIKFIIDNAMTMPLKTIAKRIGRSSYFVKNEMERQSICVPDDVRKNFALESRFKKNQKSWNKGKKQKDYMSKESIEKTKATRFKKGNVPYNTKKDFTLSYRTQKNGYMYVYIRTSKGVWELFHRWVWEQIYGKIPESHNIQFEDGDSTNCRIENLYLISKKNQARINKNGGKLLPKEYHETIFLLEKLKSKSNEKFNRRSK